MQKDIGNTHAIRALTALREKILSGELAAGKRLFEVPLAEQLNISRTPVRDAMSRLAAEGLLDRVNGGGFLVRTFSLDDIIDSIELRGLLEGASARLAAERGVSSEKIAEMETLLVAMDDCFLPNDQGVDFDLYSARNAEFHAALATLSNSNIMQRELERVNRLPFASPSAFLRDNGKKIGFTRALIIAQAQHRALIDAIVAREGARAESIAREHARIVRKNLVRMLKDKAGGQDIGINEALSLV